jgi:hypothetical protein
VSIRTQGIPAWPAPEVHPVVKRIDRAAEVRGRPAIKQIVQRLGGAEIKLVYPFDRSGGPVVHLRRKRSSRGYRHRCRILYSTEYVNES